MLNGKAKVTCKDDSKTTGEFRNFKLEGKGKVIKPGEFKYEGSFVDGKASGKGHWTT